jgi:hypothetical protein
MRASRPAYEAREVQSILSDSELEEEEEDVSLSGSEGKIKAPPMVYICGEEMTRYTAQLILERWIEPRFDVSSWEFYDLSCVNRYVATTKIEIQSKKKNKTKKPPNTC